MHLQAICSVLEILDGVGFNDHDSKLKSKDCLVGGDFRFEDICSANGCNKHNRISYYYMESCY